MVWVLCGLVLWSSTVWSGYCGLVLCGLGTVWSSTVWSGHCVVWALWLWDWSGIGLGTMRLILSCYSSGTIFEIPQMELAHPNRAQAQAGREG